MCLKTLFFTIDRQIAETESADSTVFTAHCVSQTMFFTIDRKLTKGKVQTVQCFQPLVFPKPCFLQ